jgi:peptidoglycan/xylan/chitin deacetylase (PgdA/CDA1 family)
VGYNDYYYNVHPEMFKMQMDYLRKNFNIVTLDEICNYVIKNRRLPKKSVSITFDDGFNNVYENAYPYFKEHKLPASIFITTEYVQKWIVMNHTQFKMLNWNQIKEMNKNDITIGSHTVTHPHLKKISFEKARNEIYQSKEIIQKELGNKVKYFAYPRGEYNNRIVNLVKAYGFHCAFIASEGTIRMGDHPLLLNRVDIDSSITFWMFKIKLSYAIDWYSRFEKIVMKSLTKLPLMPLIKDLYEMSNKI